MQSNKINSYVNKKLKEISRNNQLRKIHDVQRKPKNQITFVKNKFKNISYKKISKQKLHSEQISNHVAGLAKIKKIREIVNKVQISIIKIGRAHV